jgi:hypothetical protein
MPATDETHTILAIFLIVLIDVLGLMIILPLLPFYSEQFGAKEESLCNSRNSVTPA